MSRSAVFIKTYLLTKWEGRTGKYLARGHDVRTERNHYKNPFVHGSGKWEVRQEYRGVHYLDFCPGFGYFYSTMLQVHLSTLFPLCGTLVC